MKERKKLYLFFCPVCYKFDFPSGEPLAKPEHIPYRGIDVGECKGKMIKLYIIEEIENEN